MCNSNSRVVTQLKTVERNSEDVTTYLHVPFEPLIAEEKEATVPTITLKKVRFDLDEGEETLTPTTPTTTTTEQLRSRRSPIDRMAPNTPPMQPLQSHARWSFVINPSLCCIEEERIQIFGKKKKNLVLLSSQYHRTRSFIGTENPSRMTNKNTRMSVESKLKSLTFIQAINTKGSSRRISLPNCCGGRFDTNTPPLQPLEVPRRSSF